jgi:hypothetical protein
MENLPLTAVTSPADTCSVPIILSASLRGGCWEIRMVLMHLIRTVVRRRKLNIIRHTVWPEVWLESFMVRQNMEEVGKMFG